MTIASELIDLQTNLQNAKSAVTTMGGTVGDTGLAGLASEIQTIPGGGGLDTLPVEMEGVTGEGHITGYNTTTGVITGDGFGSTAGTVWLMDRDTHTYKKQAVSSWSDTSITLTTPVDLTVIEGCTSLAVEDANGVWCTKWLIEGGVAIPSGQYVIYVRDSDTGSINKIYSSTGLDGVAYTKKFTISNTTFYAYQVVGMQCASDVTLGSAINFFGFMMNLNQPVILPQTLWSSNTTGGVFMSAISFNQPIKLLDGNSNKALCASFLYGNSTFNQPISLPPTCTGIGNYFLAACSRLRQSINIPNTVTTIGTYFMTYLYLFDKIVTLPNTITSVGASFMYSSPNVYTLNVECSARPTDNNSLSNTSNQCAAYIEGVIVKGSERATWRNSLPNRTSSPYRKTIDGGA